MYLDDFSVCAVGGWDPANESVIDQLRFGHDYCRLIRKLVVSDAIRWSSEIYVEHLTGVRKLPEGA